MRKLLLTTLCAASLLLAAVFSNFSSVSAHADIEDAFPKPDSTITESPKQIRITFIEQLQLGSSLSVMDAQGNVVELAKAQIDPSDSSGKTLTADVPVALVAGEYTVNWKTLSVDGHTEKSSYKFTLDLPNVNGDLTLKFAFMAGKETVTCGKDIAALGAKRTKAQIMDARLYVTNVRLISADGKQVSVQLTPDNKWQSADVALLDFEDGKGLCKDFGTPDLRDQIVGKVPAGKYTGVAFDVGLPFEMNHANVATAKTPLNVTALWWNWQSGYKFARIELKTSAPAPKDKFLIHVGSTGCGETASTGVTAKSTASVTTTTAMTATTSMDMGAIGNKPPETPCKNQNIVSVQLTKFDPTRDMIVADLAGLLTNVDVSNPKPEPAGCMSGLDDSDCTRLFPNLGLALATGECLNGCRNQRFFRIAAMPKL